MIYGGLHHTVRCDECLKEWPAWQKKLPNFGWSIPLASLGYYGGFTDDWGSSEQRYILCHDCVVRLLTLFPGMAAQINPGGHPYDGEVPCCSWGWPADAG